MMIGLQVLPPTGRLRFGIRSCRGIPALDASVDHQERRDHDLPGQVVSPTREHEGRAIREGGTGRIPASLRHARSLQPATRFGIEEERIRDSRQEPVGEEDRIARRPARDEQLPVREETMARAEEVPLLPVHGNGLNLSGRRIPEPRRHALPWKISVVVSRAGKIQQLARMQHRRVDRKDLRIVWHVSAFVASRDGSHAFHVVHR